MTPDSRLCDRAAPKPAPYPPPLPEPQDTDYPGLVELRVDATDVQRGIFRVRERIPVPGPGPLTLLYPKWSPGFHAPASDIELLAGLEVEAAGRPLDWKRDPVEVHAFHLDVPAGAEHIDVSFQFLSRTSDSQGEISVTAAISSVRWCGLVLYPAGWFARRIQVQATLELPEGWDAGTSLGVASRDGATVAYEAVGLDVLADSPVLAGKWLGSHELDDAIRVHFATDRQDLLGQASDHVERHRALVAEADALFGGRPFERYEFLVAVSDEVGGGGVEHAASSEIRVPATYLTAWNSHAPKRDVFAHEYVHAWNGKYRQGADSWTPSFEKPIRNSLMWVYEGLTQYWGEVLTVRAGFWTPQQALDTLARTAALHANRPGGAWRPMSDTTRDPMIAAREPLPWPSWQRSEDYYAEGQLLWLEIDTLIRELSGEARSLDDFARQFFACPAPSGGVLTYGFDDVVGGLQRIADHDWRGMIQARLESRYVGAPLEGLLRGGYRLVYRPEPSAFGAETDAAAGLLNLRFGIGLVLSDNGVVQEVIWDSPAFEAGLVAGARGLAVNGDAYGQAVLKAAIAAAADGGKLELIVERGPRLQTLEVAYDGGLRFPHLEPIEGARRRLQEIYAPRR